MYSILSFISFALYIYSIIIIVNVVFSWLFAFNIVNPSNRFIGFIGNFLYRATEPVYRQVRRFLPSTGSIDFSPMIVILGIYLLQELINQVIGSYVLGY